MVFVLRVMKIVLEIVAYHQVLYHLQKLFTVLGVVNFMFHIKSVMILSLIVLSIGLLVVIYSYFEEIRNKNHPVRYIEIQIKAKLGVEYSDSPERSGRMLYPVLGKDTTTSYESKCYVSEELYNCNTCGDVIKVYKRV